MEAEAEDEKLKQEYVNKSESLQNEFSQKEKQLWVFLPCLEKCMAVNILHLQYVLCPSAGCLLLNGFEQNANTEDLCVRYWQGRRKCGIPRKPSWLWVTLKWHTAWKEGENQHYFLAKSTNFIQEEIILSGGKYVVE